MKDKIFSNKKMKITDFKFNKKVASSFDDMVNRSVPYYKQVQKDIVALASYYIKKNSRVLDLGCSTGALLVNLSKANQKKKDLKFVGIDNSSDMINIAKKKILKNQNRKNFRFIKYDFLKFKTKEKFSVIFMNYTLQFIRPLERQKLINKIYSLLNDGGIFIICEKILSKHSIFNRQFIDIYHDYKIKQGYSNIEIQKKREALENILVPFKLDENISMLKKSGFKENEFFFKWFNWVGIISKK